MKNPLYEIVKFMVRATEHRDKNEAYRLNKRYNELVGEDTDNPKYKSLDEVRQSCIISFTLPPLQQDLIEDAKRRFRNISPK